MEKLEQIENNGSQGAKVLGIIIIVAACLAIVGAVFALMAGAPAVGGILAGSAVGGLALGFLLKAVSKIAEAAELYIDSRLGSGEVRYEDSHYMRVTEVEEPKEESKE